MVLIILLLWNKLAIFHLIVKVRKANNNLLENFHWPDVRSGPLRAPIKYEYTNTFLHKARTGNLKCMGSIGPEDFSDDIGGLFCILHGPYILGVHTASVCTSRMCRIHQPVQDTIWKPAPCYSRTCFKSD